MGWDEFFERGQAKRKAPLDLRGTPSQMARLQAERATREKLKVERLRKEALDFAASQEARKAALAQKKVDKIAALYVLRDPNTRDVRYVGETTDPDTRLDSHAKGRCAPTKTWVESLGGKSPVMQVLAWYPFKQRRAAENQCIVLCLENGIALLNSTIQINRARTENHTKELAGK